MTGETRRIHAREAAAAIAVGDAVLARVVDFDGRSVFSGSHPQLLGSEVGEVAEVVARIRKRLRRESDVPVERLRKANIDAFILRTWNDVVAGGPLSRGDRVVLRPDRG